MILPSTSIHVTQKHLPRQLHLLVAEKAILFNKNKLAAASYTEQVGIMTDYRFLETNGNCGGYCNYENKVIAINTTHNKAYQRKTLVHEIGHALQAEAEVFEKVNARLLSDRLRVEWQCETIAYLLYNSIYKNKLPHSDFDAYLKPQDIEWYKQWASEWLQDDFTNGEHKISL